MNLKNHRVSWQYVFLLILFLFTGVLTACAQTGQIQSQDWMTEVSIVGEQFLINETPTYEGRSWTVSNGEEYNIEGLLMNARLVQGVFDDHPILQCERVHELIELAKNMERDGRSLYVSTSLGGGGVPPANIVEASDFVFLHGNGVSNPEQMVAMIREVREMDVYTPMPIVNNEVVASATETPFEFQLEDMPSGEHWVRARAAYNNGEHEVIIESPWYRNPWWPYGGRY